MPSDRPSAAQVVKGLKISWPTVALVAIVCAAGVGCQLAGADETIVAGIFGAAGGLLLRITS